MVIPLQAYGDTPSRDQLIPFIISTSFFVWNFVKRYLILITELIMWRKGLPSITLYTISIMMTIKICWSIQYLRYMLIVIGTLDAPFISAPLPLILIIGVFTRVGLDGSTLIYIIESFERILIALLSFINTIYILWLDRIVEMIRAFSWKKVTHSLSFKVNTKGSCQGFFIFDKITCFP